MKEFMECAACRAKPGCPTLCEACLHNRALVNELRDARERRQRDIFAWTKEAFGEAEATSFEQRGLRLLEEAIEAYQAVGGHADVAHRLVDFVFGRPVGDIAQELGGVQVCVLALAASVEASADEEERREVARVLSKPVEHFRKRNAAKNAAGFKAGNK